MGAMKEPAKGINKQPICNTCKHHKRGETCAAFSYIPDLILSGTNEHKKPLPSQQNKIVFEPLENA